MEPDDHISADLAALQAIEGRYAGTPGERAALDLVRARLPDSIAARIEGLVGHHLPWMELGLHGGGALAFGVLGAWYPALGAIGCALVSVSLMLEGTGRLGPLRMWLWRRASYNLVLPPAEDTSPLGTLILSTPLDAPRVHVRRPRFWRRPLRGVLGSTVTLAVLLLLRALSEEYGTPLYALYWACLGVNALTSLMVLVTMRRAEPSSGAGGIAALMEVARRLDASPVPGLAVWTVFTGCGHAHQDGMKTFLTLRGHRLPQPVLVVSVDQVDRAPLRAAVTEGPLLQQPQRPTGPALVERLRWAGVRIPAFDRPETSDSLVATVLGYRAVALIGGDEAADATSVRSAADVIETLARWYGEDLARVAVARAALPPGPRESGDPVED